MNKPACLSIAIAAVGLAVAGGSAWAGKMDCSGTKRSLSSPYSEVIDPGDDTFHQLKHQIRVHAIARNDPDFDGAEQTVYAHQDEYAGAGTSVGYFLYALKSGEKIWARFDSVYSTVSSPGSGERWESTYQGISSRVGNLRIELTGAHRLGQVADQTGAQDGWIGLVKICLWSASGLRRGRRPHHSMPARQQRRPPSGCLELPKPQSGLL